MCWTSRTSLAACDGVFGFGTTVAISSTGTGILGGAAISFEDADSIIRNGLVCEVGTRSVALKNFGLVVTPIRLAPTKLSNDRRVCELYSLFHGLLTAPKTEQGCEFWTTAPSSRSPQHDHKSSRPAGSPQWVFAFSPNNFKGTAHKQTSHAAEPRGSLGDHHAPKWLNSGQKALNCGTHPQTGPVPVHPVKTWRFAIFSPSEVLAKMAYGSGVKNQGLERPTD